MMESGIINTLKIGQQQTNQRLDALIAEQKNTSAWLARIAQLLEQQSAAVHRGSAPPQFDPSNRPVARRQ